MAKYFIIEKNTLGQVRLLFDDEDIVVEKKYPLEQENLFSIEKLNSFRAEPMDEFLFSVEIDGKKSQNISPVVINYPVEEGVPAVINTILDEGLNEIINISDYIPYENYFDRIEITEVSGKGTWMIGSTQIAAGETYFYYQIFDNLKFTSSTPGAQEDYASLKFKFATKDITFEDENSIVINTSSIAQLDSELDITTYTENEFEVKQFTLQLTKQMVNKTFQIKSEILIQNLELDALNKVVFEFDNTTEEYNTNGNKSFTHLNIDEYGAMFFNVKVKMKQAFMPGDNMKVILDNIDNDTALVDKFHNTVTINF